MVPYVLSHEGRAPHQLVTIKGIYSAHPGYLPLFVQTTGYDKNVPYPLLVFLLIDFIMFETLTLYFANLFVLTLGHY